MRRLLAVATTVASTGLLLTLSAGPAAADDPVTGASSDGAGTYTVKVSVTGNGVGSGGSLGQGSVSSSGGTVSVPSPCGFMDLVTQEEIEARYNGDKQAAENDLRIGDSDNGYAWSKTVLAHWGQKGTWYAPFCTSSGSNPTDEQFMERFFAENDPVLVAPGAGGAPTPKLDPKFLEEIAIKAMTLPTPTIQYNPKSGADNRSFVNLPGGTWFWAEQRPAAGGSCVASPCVVTASAAGASVTVTATLQNITFSTNGPTKNGRSSVSCPDGGKAYTRGAATDSSDCVFEYIRSSGAGSYTVDSGATWSASSSLGTAIPGAVMTDRIQLKVSEIQTVNR